jgi:hypothetical protein
MHRCENIKMLQEIAVEDICIHAARNIIYWQAVFIHFNEPSCSIKGRLAK